MPSARSRDTWARLCPPSVTIRIASISNSRLKRLRVAPIDTSQPIIGLDQVSTEPGQLHSGGAKPPWGAWPPEIIIEGANDDRQWKQYHFKYKPGDLKCRPRFNIPHQPRLDWQMWFAALGNYRNNPWILHFMQRLLEGAPPVLDLLERNPFPDEPPRYIRAVLYQYNFTDWNTKKTTGAWWQRKPLGLYTPPISLRQ